ncbi:hypothetical protein D9619_011771 [Psilocybe cf. subviscida]|uniref:RanBP2-type domain-containing protein n=1 Tax=Psilocybe cf. subviscida TaxID=2480587 RepID=A0A8H5B0C7_9AGAR|nr:hypothetical protein D9619_011771 [Psilocybe cf. subviscida]
MMATSALSLSGRAMSVAPALESELEPFSKLRRVVLQQPPPQPFANTPSSSSSAAAVHRLQHQPSLNNAQAPIDLPPPASIINTTQAHNTPGAQTPGGSHQHHHLRRISASLSDLQSYQKEQTRGEMMGNGNGMAIEYTLSSNPPNPKTNFRLGDWICPSTNCAAHNFGRNLSCIGCGCPRSTPSSNGNNNSSMMNANSNSFGGPGQHDLLRQYHQHNLASSSNRATSSPRFSNNNNNAPPPSAMSAQQSNGPSNVYYSSAPPPPPAFVQQAQHLQSQQQQHNHPHDRQHNHPHQHQNHQPHHSQQQQQQHHSSQTQHRTQLPSTPSASLLPHIAIGHPSGHSTANPPSINIGVGPGAVSVGMHSTIGGSSSGPGGVGTSSGMGSGSGSGVGGKPHSQHPLLTPSGRAFAVGGKVQNVSSDPLTPCIMYWPDNEPLPEQGQIRPNNLVGVAVTEDLFLINLAIGFARNAEGNGDSISAAVQAERIALLTSVLAQTNINGIGPSASSPSPANLGLMPSGHGQRPLHHQMSHHQLGMNTLPSSHQLQPPPHHHHSATQTPRSHSMTPPQERRPFIDLLAPSSSGPALHHHQNGGNTSNALNAHRPVHRSQSHFALGQQYSGSTHLAAPALNGSGLQPNGGLHPHYTASSPIYQTSGHRPEPRQPSPLYMTGPDVGHHQSQSRQQRSHTTSQLLPHPTQTHERERFNTISSANIPTLAPTPTSGMLTGGLTAPALLQTQTQKPAAPAPLLPAFLQDMVQSPALSPTSTTTSSADLSSIEEYEEYEELSPPAQQRVQQQQQQQQQQGQQGYHPDRPYDQPQHLPQQQQHAVFPRARGDSGSSAAAAADALSIGLGAGAGANIGGGTGLIVARPSEMLPPNALANIWRLDGEETKSLNAFPLPNHQELVGAQRKSSREGLRGVVGV